MVKKKEKEELMLTTSSGIAVVGFVKESEDKWAYWIVSRKMSSLYKVYGYSSTHTLKYVKKQEFKPLIPMSYLF